MKSVGCFRAISAPRASRPRAASRANGEATGDGVVSVFGHRLPRMVGMVVVWVESSISHGAVTDVGVADLPSASGLPVRMWLCGYGADFGVVTDRSAEADVAVWVI